MLFKKRKKEEGESTHSDSLRTILLNAIKMQALYSGGKIRFVDTSSLVH